MNSATKLIVVGHGSKMGLKMEPAIAALLSHGTVGAAAKAVGLGENTLLRWMKDPKFEKALSAARDQMFVHAMGRLQGAATGCSGHRHINHEQPEIPHWLSAEGRGTHPATRPQDGTRS